MFRGNGFTAINPVSRRDIVYNPMGRDFIITHRKDRIAYTV